MSGMIERVAKAIYETWASNRSVTEPWDELVSLGHSIVEEARQEARAAIGAMYPQDADLPEWLQMDEEGRADWERRGRMADVISRVESGLRSYFEKRAPDNANWLRSKDGGECIRMSDPICLDEITAHVVSAISGAKLDDLIGENFEVEF